MSEAQFPKLDSRTPEFWNVRYAAQFTPWDAGTAPAQLREFAAREARGQRVLIPGCGSGYEIAWFLRQGWEVTAIDFSAKAIEAAQRVLGADANHVIQADFFHWQPPQAFDVVYERTFFCALKSEMRRAYAERMAQLLRPGGRLVGYFYYETDKEGGPPFAMAPGTLEQVLAADFVRLDGQPVGDSIALFVGKERWEIWQRR